MITSSTSFSLAVKTKPSSFSRFQSMLKPGTSLYSSTLSSVMSKH